MFNHIRRFHSSSLQKYAEMIKSSKFLESYLPRTVTHHSQLSKLIESPSNDYDIASISKSISEPSYNILDRGGKMWRGSLCLLTADIYQHDPKEILPLAHSIEVIHNASLICDDIEDKSDKRRGLPCTHKIYGIDVALNCGNFMYFLPLRIINDLAIDIQYKEKILKTYSEEMIQLHLGQCTDISWNNDKSYMPSEDQYYRMVFNKTSVLVRMAVKFALNYFGHDDATSHALIRYAEKIGVSFQIIDDILNLASPVYKEGRSFLGEDITEGKKTLIIIRAISQAKNKAERLNEILAMHTSDLSLVNEALDIINSTDAIDYAKNIAIKLKDEAWNPLNELLPSSEAKESLATLSEMVCTRVK